MAPDQMDQPVSVREPAAVILPAHPHALQPPPRVAVPVVHVGPPAAGESAGQEEVPVVVHRHEAAGV